MRLRFSRRPRPVACADASHSSLARSCSPDVAASTLRIDEHSRRSRTTPCSRSSHRVRPRHGTWPRRAHQTGRRASPGPPTRATCGGATSRAHPNSSPTATSQRSKGSTGARSSWSAPTRPATRTSLSHPGAASHASTVSASVSRTTPAATKPWACTSRWTPRTTTPLSTPNPTPTSRPTPRASTLTPLTPDQRYEALGCDCCQAADRAA